MPLPSAHRGGAKWIPEESVRYALTSPEAFDEWLWTATAGDGNVHYGPGRRLFVVAVTHELHCLRSYRAALAQDAVPHGHHQLAHLTHCLNFFRTSTLCAADTTLDPLNLAELRPDGTGGGTNGVGVAHVYRDWGQVYDFVHENQRVWPLQNISDDQRMG